MADLRIVDAPEILLQDVEDGLKLPTGGFGNYAITMSTISDWLVRYKDLALKSYVSEEFGKLGTASKYNVEDLPISVAQQNVNSQTVKFVDSVADLLTINNPKDGDVAYVVDIDDHFLFANGVWERNSNSEVNIKDFPRLNAEMDDTQRFYRAIASMKFFDSNSPSGYAIYARSSLILPSGYYQISDEIVLDPFTTVVKSSGTAIIKQMNATKNIFSHNDVWSCSFHNIKFVGGKHHIYLQNENRDATVVSIDDCEFHYSSDYAIKTWGTWDQDPHLSMKLTINNPKFIQTNGILYNVCDIATISGGWAFPSKNNFSEDRAVIVNRYGVLQMNNVLGVPSFGMDSERMKRVRWVDNYGRFQAHQTRFGGEDHGIPIVYTFKPEYWLSDEMGTSVIIRDCQTYCGLSYKYPASGACVVYLEESVPQQIILEGNNYQLASPYIACNPNFNLDGEFLMYDAKKRYKFKIDTNMTWGEDHDSRSYPLQLSRFMNSGRVDENITQFNPKSEGMISKTKYKVTFEIPKRVKSFTIIATVSTNFNPDGNSSYRKTASFLVSMNTEWDGSRVCNELKNQILMRSEKDVPSDIIDIYQHFGESETGDATRTDMDGGYFSLVFDGCGGDTLVTVIPLVMN